MLESFAQWATQVVYYSGYFGVAGLILLSNLFLPIPSELVLPFAGFLVGQGFFSFPLLMLAASAGALVGALVVYAPARRLGEGPVRWFIKRYGRFVLLGEPDLDKASGWFDHHGGEAVLIGRLVPGVGALISVPAGIEQMLLWKFLIYTTIGNGIWNAVFIGLGWALGSQWDLVSQYAAILKYAVLTVLAGAILRFSWRRFRAHNK
jgi:membrane protein DedA with SNARE-associated domain